MEKTSSSLKPTQLAAGSAAAITTAFLGSRMGIAGTLVGAGITSLITTVGTAAYQHSLDRTGKTLRTHLAREYQPTPNVDLQEAPTVPLRIGDALIGPKKRFRPSWKALAAGAGLVFVVAMTSITTIELAAGAPISGGNQGTTVSGLFGVPTHTTTTTHPTHHRMAPVTLLPPLTTTQTPQITTQVTTSPSSSSTSPGASQSPTGSQRPSSPDSTPPVPLIPSS